jgi:hypothetical protein
MEQEARTRLTKESIHGELMRVSRRRMLICTVVFALSLVVVVPVALLLFHRFADEWKWLVIFLFTVTYCGEGVYLTLPAGLEFWRLITGRYRVEEDTLVEILTAKILERLK